MQSVRKIELLSPTLNVDAALHRLGGDVELFDQIILIYLEDAPNLMHAARQALAESNPVELRRAAHSIKGMMATLGAQAGVNSALKLEQSAAADDLSNAPSLIFECGEKVAELTHVLDAYYHSGSGSESQDSRSAR